MNLLRCSLIVTFLLSTTLAVFAANLSEVKNAMKERQPAIEALWAAGKIGENNKGFVEARADLSEGQKKMVQAENADRKIVYQAIARSTIRLPIKLVSNVPYKFPSGQQKGFGCRMPTGSGFESNFFEVEGRLRWILNGII